MSLTTEPPFTGLWEVAAWRSTLMWLYQWLKDLASFGGIGRGVQRGDNTILAELLPQIKTRQNGIPDSGVRATRPPHGDTADAVEDIAVAIELKFLVPLLPFAADRCSHQGADAHGVVAPACSAEEAALTSQAYELVAESIRLVAGQRSVTLPEILRGGRQERDFWASLWIVKKANSVTPRDDDGTHPGFHWVPVEICSPKLHWKDPCVRNAIGAVLRSLDTRHGIVVNYTCDVHVHVGRMDGCEFNLGTLQRLATILWLAEDVLRGVRNPLSPNFHNVYTWGAEIRQHSRLAESLNRGCAMKSHDSSADSDPGIGAVRLEAGEYHAINSIWAVRSHLELGRMLSGSTRQYRRLGFNFSSLGEEDDRARHGPKTVEFRILEGTLCDDIVLPWTSICCALVETAVGGPKDQFRHVVTCLLREGTNGCRSKRDVVERLGNLIDSLGIGDGMAGAFLDNVRRNRTGTDASEFEKALL